MLSERAGVLTGSRTSGMRIRIPYALPASEILTTRSLQA